MVLNDHLKEGKAITDKLKCVALQMKPPCTADIVALVRNYYRETLPDDCSQYIPRLDTPMEMRNDQSKRTVNETNFVKNSQSKKAPVKMEPLQKFQSNRTGPKIRIFVSLAGSLFGSVVDSSILLLRILYIYSYIFLWNLSIYSVL
ncbi:uncharacterized protein DEA37_0013161 [Paragonimus westermani]|uniref:Uncharacterized protein n=1 Tax=Paragonimus westermani TaxID=34504 RepID=A0A5J4NYJ1_9TREM|nr:uncharacterized protein DEA37_0013161 [Paragonimus westermani]